MKEMRLKGNLAITALDDEGIIYDFETRRTFQINNTAAHLLNMLDSNKSGCSNIREISRMLCASYSNCTDSKVAQDVDTFVERLYSFGLVQLQASQGGNTMTTIDISGDDSRVRAIYTKPFLEPEREIQPISGMKYTGCGN